MESVAFDDEFIVEATTLVASYESKVATAHEEMCELTVAKLT